MNTYHSNLIKKKFKHLTREQIEYVVNKVNEHEIKNKGKKRNTGKTKLIKDISQYIATSVSNIYAILKDARITIKDYDLREREELSAAAAYSKRSRKSGPSNNLKLHKAMPFIELVVQMVKENRLTSIDEAVHVLKLFSPNKIEGMETVSTKTFYNYIHAELVPIKPIDLPRMCRRKPSKKNYKTYIPKRQKGKPITERPQSALDRAEFGHWEGDLVTGPRDGKNGAFLTLLERKTRFCIILPIPSKSSKNVYMKINRLHKEYGPLFSEVFKSITFDNGSEFSRYKDMEKKPGTNKTRTSIYFATPYCSFERGSNENCNQLIRYYYPKGTDLGKIPKKKVQAMNKQINQKHRKILGYQNAEDLFIKELGKIQEKIYGTAWRTGCPKLYF